MNPKSCLAARPSLRPAALSLAIAASAGAAMASEAPWADRQLAQAPSAPSPRIGVSLDEEWLLAAAGELGQEKVVKGAPYCADAVHESIQWLADEAGGAPNRIVRRSQSRLCRDGEGRTRQEVTRGDRALVYLRDPMSREAWVLEPSRKTARRLSVAPAVPAAAAHDNAAWQDYVQRMRAWAAEISRSVRGLQPPPVPPVPPVPAVPGVPAVPQPPAVPAVPGAATTEKVAPVAVQRSEVAVVDPAASGGTRREVRVMVLRPGAAEAGVPPLPPAPPAPPAVTWRAQSLAPRGPAVSTLLPPKDIEGLRASGERSTWTIEAGRIGNERPIQIVREVWTSHDLGLTLLSRDVDPRSGEQVYRLQNIRRGEPDAALMRVPADYAVQGRGGARPAASAAGRG